MNQFLDGQRPIDLLAKDRYENVQQWLAKFWSRSALLVLAAAAAHEVACRFVWAAKAGGF